MKRQLLLGATLATLAAVCGTNAQVPDNVPSFDGYGERRIDPRIAEFAVISKAAKAQEGLFKIYHHNENVYAELQPQHFGKLLLCPIAIAKGAGVGGSTLNFDEQWVLTFKRQGDKVHLIRKNVHHKARGGSPTAKAVENTYTDSVLMSLRIAAINQQTQGVLINLNDIFMSDFGELGMGRFDANRSVWAKVKAFPKNIELQVQATYTGGHTDQSDIDDRGRTIVVHYGLCELPDGGYTPRVADDRVGHFITAVKDYSTTSKDTAFVRYVNRWRLEPAEPMVAGKLSVPRRSIKFYVEKTVPHEYRAAVAEGILEWNKAFEKIGFRNAIEVVQQRDDEEFDPEDMNYSTVRWVTGDRALAVGPSRANPLTGEILDADITFDADYIRYWKHERQIFRTVNGQEIEFASPIEAMDLGAGLNHSLLNRGANSTGWNDQPASRNLAAVRAGVCQCRNHMKMEFGMAAMALVEAEAAAKGKDKDKKDEKKETKDALIDQLINQAIKETVMHEVGHTLGLRHNFKGSTMLKANELHDTKITREKGLSGSVMDYNPVNIAPKGVKQGDFFSTTLGPYDYWAIEYAYKPITGSEADELKKIASRGASEPGLDYGTDEDTFLNADPMTNRWDMGSDVLKFSQDRITSSADLMKTLANRVVEDGEGYQRNRIAFNILLGQYGNGAYLVSKYVGGEHAYRDHLGDAKGRDPLVPVTAAKQREAMEFLKDKIFADATFTFPPELLRKLAVERWSHWGADVERTDFDIYARILGIQRTAMNQLLSARTLSRVQANAMKGGEDKPVTIAEVFRCVTDGVWSDLPKNGDKAIASSIQRRNLQREHLKKLSAMVAGEKTPGPFSDANAVPPDAKSLARLHLQQLNAKIDNLLKAKPDIDETSLAHLSECKERIAKVLSASLQVTE